MTYTIAVISYTSQMGVLARKWSNNNNVLEFLGSPITSSIEYLQGSVAQVKGGENFSSEPQTSQAGAMGGVRGG